MDRHLMQGGGQLTPCIRVCVCVSSLAQGLCENGMGRGLLVYHAHPHLRVEGTVLGNVHMN